MKRAAVIFSAFLLMGSNDVPHQDLLGVWKSNEEMTLASMRATPGVTKKAKDIFENDFFGRLIIEYKIDSYRARYEDEEDNIDEFHHYYPYRVLDRGDNYYILETRIPLVKDNLRQKTIYMDGECYYQLVSRWNFREYFCRIQQ
jgi:hypothetical protein